MKDKIVKLGKVNIPKGIFFTDSTKNAKNLMVANGGTIVSVKNGEYTDSIHRIMPDITNVKVVENGKTRITQVFFADGTSEKAVLNEDDIYSYDIGISICITKKLLSDKSSGQGGSLYNKIISRAKKITYKKQEEEAKRQADERAEKIRYERHVEKKKKKRERKEAEAIEKIANILASAIAKSKEIITSE